MKGLHQRFEFLLHSSAKHLLLDWSVVALDSLHFHTMWSAPHVYGIMRNGCQRVSLTQLTSEVFDLTGHCKQETYVRTYVHTYVLTYQVFRYYGYCAKSET